MATRESLLEVSVFGQSDGQAVNSVFELMALATDPAPPTLISLEDVADSVITRMTVDVAPHNSSFWSFNRVVVKTITAIQDRISRGRHHTRRIYGEQFEKVLGSAVVGGRVGPATPTYVAYTVRFKTARAGKSFRGGKRFGPLFEDDTVTNLVEPARLALVRTAMSHFTNPSPSVIIPGFNFAWVVFGARAAVLAGTLAEPFRTFAPALTSVLVNDVVGSQVSRKRAAISLA